MRRLAVIIVLGLVVGACGRVAEKVAENVAENQPGVGNVDINQTDGTVKLEVKGDEEEGSVVFGGGDVPSDFPIPLPDGGEVQTVVDATQNSERTVSVTVTYPLDRYDEIVEFYKEWADGLPGDTQVAVTTGSYKNAIFVNDTEGLSVARRPEPFPPLRR